ncbi:MAG: hypothetical protein NC131_17755 [Roseburia sp.]|nr:hypothetical protein [Roseburia sp.]
MKRKFLAFLIAIVSALTVSLAFSACFDEDNGGSLGGEDNGESSGGAYEQVDEEQWKQAITDSVNAANYVSVEQSINVDWMPRTQTIKRDGNVFYATPDPDNYTVATSEIYAVFDSATQIKTTYTRNTSKDEWETLTNELGEYSFLEEQAKYSVVYKDLVQAGFEGGRNIYYSYSLFVPDGNGLYTGTLRITEEAQFKISVGIKNGKVVYINNVWLNGSNGKSTVTVTYGNASLTPPTIGGEEENDKPISEAQWQSIITATVLSTNYTYVQTDNGTLALTFEVDGDIQYSKTSSLEKYTVYEPKTLSKTEYTLTASDKDYEIASSTFDTLDKFIQFKDGNDILNVSFMLGQFSGTGVNSQVLGCVYELYDLFTYDEETSLYTANLMLGTTDYKLSLRFSDGKVNHIENEYVADVPIKSVIEIEYGNASLKPPVGDIENGEDKIDVAVKQVVGDYKLISLIDPDGNELIDEAPEFTMVFNADMTGTLTSVAVGGTQEFVWTLEDNVISIVPKNNDGAEPTVYVYDGGYLRCEEGGGVQVFAKNLSQSEIAGTYKMTVILDENGNDISDQLDETTDFTVVLNADGTGTFDCIALYGENPLEIVWTLDCLVISVEPKENANGYSPMLFEYVDGELHSDEEYGEVFTKVTDTQ